MQPNPANLPIGGVFADRYEIISSIRAGGMGAVYEVLDRRNQRRRALKVMLPQLAHDPRFRDRFEREATVTGKIESEHIVEVLDAGVDQATAMPFLAMELLRGEDLAARLTRGGRLGADETVALLGQAAMALDRTHAAGVIHRDLKPENLFVTARDDGTPLVKVLDFGIAKLVGPASDGRQTTGIPGTPVYMAPEQLNGDKDIGLQADIYALGHIAYTLLVGTEYWSDEIEAAGGGIYPLLIALVQGIKEAPSARAARRGVALSAEFDSWFMMTTASDRALRPDSASEAIAGLAQAVHTAAPARCVVTLPRLEGGGPRSAVDTSGRTVAVSTAGLPKRRSAIPLLVGVAALALGGAAWVLWPRANVEARTAVEAKATLEAPAPAPVATASNTAKAAPPASAKPAVTPAPATATPSASTPPAATPPSSDPVPAHTRPHDAARPTPPPPREASPPRQPPPPTSTARRRAQGADDPGF